ncbi:MAG: Pr6Pr family membrane protein [Amphiplicatus sp.]
MSMTTLWRGAIALLGWYALGLQLWLRLFDPAPPGPALSLLNFFSYFTILTNILIALSMTFAALPGTRGAAGLFKRTPVRTALTLYIAVVGTVYFLILRHTWDPQGWQLVADRLLHYVIPVLALLDWIFVTPKQGLKPALALRWLSYPAAYGAYVLIRGGIDGFYPYPFLDVSNLGYGRVLINLAVLLAVFTAGGLGLIGLAKVLIRKATP